MYGSDLLSITLSDLEFSVGIRHLILKTSFVLYTSCFPTKTYDQPVSHSFCSTSNRLWYGYHFNSRYDNILIACGCSCKSALNPPVVCSTDRSKAVVPVLVLLFVALWFILRGDLLYVVPCVILFLCFSVLLVLRLPRLGKRELILVLFVRLLGLCLFGFVGFLFLLGSGNGCGLCFFTE